jgi:hypothetical protein
MADANRLSLAALRQRIVLMRHKGGLIGRSVLAAELGRVIV